MMDSSGAQDAGFLLFRTHQPDLSLVIIDIIFRKQITKLAETEGK